MSLNFRRLTEARQGSSGCCCATDAGDLLPPVRLPPVGVPESRNDGCSFAAPVLKKYGARHSNCNVWAEGGSVAGWNLSSALEEGCDERIEFGTERGQVMKPFYGRPRFATIDPDWY